MPQARGGGFRRLPPHAADPSHHTVCWMLVCVSGDAEEAFREGSQEAFRRFRSVFPREAFKKRLELEMRISSNPSLENPFFGEEICPREVPIRRLELKICISSNPGLENVCFGKEFCPRESSKKRLELKIRISSNPRLGNVRFGKEFCSREASKKRLELKLRIS